MTFLGAVVLLGIGALIAVVVGLLIKAGIKDTINEFLEDMKKLISDLKK